MFKYKLRHFYDILDKLQSYFSNGIRNASMLHAWSCQQFSSLKYDLCRCNLIFLCYCNRIGGVTVSVLASSVVDRRFQPLSNQTSDYEIGICCFSAKVVVLKRKSKDWLARNQDNVSEWGDMSIR